MGFASAVQLSREGIEVIAISRNFDSLRKLRDQSGCKIIQFDLLNEQSDSLLLKLKEEGVYALSGLIHNAGLLVNKPFGSITAEELQKVYSTNILTPFLLTQSLLPLLKSGAPSHVINISSMGGVQGSVKFAGLSAYSSSKGALSILTECLATELKEHGITVNCLALGSVQTEMLSQAFPGYKASMQPEETGTLISWFLQNGDKFFNGKILPVAVSTP